MKCQTCQTRTDSRKDRKAHSIETGHDFYVPTTEAIAEYETKIANQPEQTYYISPVAIFFGGKAR